MIEKSFVVNEGVLVTYSALLALYNNYNDYYSKNIVSSVCSGGGTKMDLETKKLLWECIIHQRLKEEQLFRLKSWIDFDLTWIEFMGYTFM